MTNSQQADKLQIKPLDKNAAPSVPSSDLPDPRVTAFLDRLRQKAVEIEDTVRDNHVTVKAPRQRPVVEQPAHPDWYQPQSAKKAAESASPTKRFSRASSSSGRKPNKPV
ncbi:MAG: hypothetical protein LCI00_11085 [Chloroflexi bacterium]|nr:hypothetical protein [Chloroflexota bacterium]MCC6891900.1 hypothetical protein [Anaerolineae bacterium]